MAIPGLFDPLKIFEREDPKSVSEVGASAARTTADTLPTIFDAITKALGPFEQARLDAAKQVSPGYIDIGSQQKRAGAATDTGILKDFGEGLVTNLRSTDKTANPEYYALTEAMMPALQQLLSSYNLSGGLSDSEAAAVERSTNKGNISSGVTKGSKTTDVANALNYQDYFDQKRQGLSNAIGLTAGVAPTTKSIDTGQVVFNRPQQPNPITQFGNFGQNQTATAGQALGGLQNYAGQASIALTDKPSPGEIFGASLPDC